MPPLLQAAAAAVPVSTVGRSPRRLLLHVCGCSCHAHAHDCRTVAPANSPSPATQPSLLFPTHPVPDGNCIVEVQISAHHTGTPFALPGLPEVAPSGRRVSMEPEFLRVRVEGEQIKEIVVRGEGVRLVLAGMAK